MEPRPRPPYMTRAQLMRELDIVRQQITTGVGAARYATQGAVTIADLAQLPMKLGIAFGELERARARLLALPTPEEDRAARWRETAALIALTTAASLVAFVGLMLAGVALL